MCGTGTHDNETTVGWWNDSAQDSEKEYIKRYLHTNGKDIAGDFMRESFKSVSKTSIVMLQVNPLRPLTWCFQIPNPKQPCLNTPFAIAVLLTAASVQSAAHLVHQETAETNVWV